MLKKDYHTKRLAFYTIIFASIGLVIVSETVREYFLRAIKNSLDYEPIYPLVIFGSLLVGLLYSFYHSKSAQPIGLKPLLKIFGPFFDPPTNTLTYGIVIASVLRLIRGLFNQAFFEIEYFKDFGVINVSAIGLACIPLLIWSFTGLGKYAILVFKRRPDDIGEVTPLEERDTP